MSLPETEEELLRRSLTHGVAGLTEHCVSTGCPECATRFAMLARFDVEGWHLRCTVCGWRSGELK